MQLIKKHWELVRGVPERFSPDYWNTGSFCSDFGRSAFRWLMQDWEDCSFSIVVDDEPVLVASCTTSDEGISFYRTPVLLSLKRELSEADFAIALAYAFEKFEELALTTVGARVRIWNHSPVLQYEGLTLVDKFCSDLGGQKKRWIRAVADLSLSIEKLQKDVRKSYKSLINWGKKNFETVIAPNSEPISIAISNFAELYHATSGQVLTDQYWQVVQKHLESEGGELILGYYSGALISGALFIDTQSVTNYTMAAYDREHFDKPLGHWPIFLAMTRAKERHQRWFDLGDIDTPQTVESEKYSNIAFFKKGFSSRSVKSIEWIIPFVSDQTRVPIPPIVA